MSQTRERYFEITLLGLILILGGILFYQATPFINGILGAITLYLLLRRANIYMSRKVSRRFTPWIIVGVLTVFILIPLSYLVWYVIDMVQLQANSLNIQILVERINRTLNSLEDKLGIDLVSENSLKFITARLTSIAQMLMSGINNFAVTLFTALLILFFLLSGGIKMEMYIARLLPFNETNKLAVISNVTRIVRSSAIGIPLLALIQGIIASICYYFIGIPNSIQLGILTGFASLIPIVGTMLVWIPVAINQYLDGNVQACVLVVLCGIVVISQCDNLLRMIMQKRMANIHPLITIFGVVVGLPIFGFMGLIFGPLLVAMFLLFLDMFARQYILGEEEVCTSANQPHKSKKGAAHNSSDNYDGNDGSYGSAGKAISDGSYGNAGGNGNAGNDGGHGRNRTNSQSGFGGNARKTSSSSNERNLEHNSHLSATSDNTNASDRNSKANSRVSSSSNDSSLKLNTLSPKRNSDGKKSNAKKDFKAAKAEHKQQKREAAKMLARTLEGAALEHGERPALNMDDSKFSKSNKSSKLSDTKGKTKAEGKGKAERTNRNERNSRNERTEYNDLAARTDRKTGSAILDASSSSSLVASGTHATSDSYVGADLPQASGTVASGTATSGTATSGSTASSRVASSGTTASAVNSFAENAYGTQFGEQAESQTKSQSKTQFKSQAKSHDEVQDFAYNQELADNQEHSSKTAQANEATSQIKSTAADQDLGLGDGNSLTKDQASKKDHVSSAENKSKSTQDRKTESKHQTAHHETLSNFKDIHVDQETLERYSNMSTLGESFQQPFEQRYNMEHQSEGQSLVSRAVADALKPFNDKKFAPMEFSRTIDNNVESFNIPLKKANVAENTEDVHGTTLNSSTAKQDTMLSYDDAHSSNFDYENERSLNTHRAHFDYDDVDMADNKYTSHDSHDNQDRLADYVYAEENSVKEDQNPTKMKRADQSSHNGRTGRTGRQDRPPRQERHERQDRQDRSSRAESSRTREQKATSKQDQSRTNLKDGRKKDKREKVASDRTNSRDKAQASSRGRNKQTHERRANEGKAQNSKSSSSRDSKTNNKVNSKQSERSKSNNARGTSRDRNAKDRYGNERNTRNERNERNDRNSRKHDQHDNAKSNSRNSSKSKHYESSHNNNFGYEILRPERKKHFEDEPILRTVVSHQYGYDNKPKSTLRTQLISVHTAKGTMIATPPRRNSGKRRSYH